MNEWLRFTLSPLFIPDERDESALKTDYSLVDWVLTLFSEYSAEVSFISSDTTIKARYQSSSATWSSWLPENEEALRSCTYIVDVAIPVSDDSLSDHAFGYLQALIFELDFNLMELFYAVNETSKTVAMSYGCRQRPASAPWNEDFVLWPGFDACLEFDGDAQQVFRHGFEDVELPAIDFPPEDDDD